jgi:hypothetical protein
MSFLTPLAFIGALIGIPIILMYMLRLRRREVMVSSTYLWQQVLRDNEANTPWQRLRRNLLLLLQLIILALLVLTLARPFMIVPAVSSGQTALLLDASASMNATDINGDSRFNEARRRALDIVDTMSATDQMTVIRVAEVAEVLSPYTDNHDVLRAAINNAQPSDASGDWVGALTLASAKAASTENFHVVIISDGGVGSAANLPGIAGDVRYVPIGTSGSNQAITALATSALPGKPPQLFAQVHNYADQAAEVVFSLRIGGAFVTSQKNIVPTKGDWEIVSPPGLLPATFSTIEGSIAPSADSKVPDYLAADDNAWAVSTVTASRRVLLMTANNLFLEQVLRSSPGIQVVKGDLTRGLPTQSFDLYVFDGWLPNALPNGDLLIIDPPHSTPLFTLGAPSTATGNPVVDRSDPRMTFVDFSGINILKFTPAINVDWGKALIRVDGGPLLLAGDEGGRQVALLTFDLHDSDLPLQIAFPVLMSNLLDWFTPRSVISVGDALKVGQSLAIRPPLDAAAVRITLPDSTERTLPVDRQTLAFADTQTPGLYKLDILNGDKVIQSQPFAVNLFDPGESDIAPVQQLKLGGTTIATTGREEVGQREFWQEAALLALLVLLIEWFVYHRRLRVPTLMSPVLRRQRAT